ncbi:MAG: hypothetical protein WC760_05880 [Bacteroidia bacterium]|jgi:hypothetical protein
MQQQLRLLIFSFVLIGCGKDRDVCSDSKTYTYTIEEGTKAKVPYTGLESLVFISNTGDTAKLTGMGKSEYFKEYAYSSDLNPDCNGVIDYQREEINDYTFYGPSLLIDKIVFSTKGGLITAGAGGIYNGRNTDYESFQINCNGILVLSFYIQPTYANDTTQYTEPVLINGKTISGRRLGSQSLLYNYQYGILQFTDTLQHKTWTINF